MNQPENAIVVAVGVNGAPAAIRFAVEAARRAHTSVHLVHVVQLTSVDAYAGIYGVALEAGDAALTQAAANARELGAPDVPVTVERVDNGRLVADLLQRANQSLMVVLQHRRLSRLHRLVTGSTVNAIAARATVPVVSVPEDWRPGVAASLVTAAVQDGGEAVGLLRHAFEQARIMGADLDVLHAWWLTNGFEIEVVDQDFRQEWETRSRHELAPALEPLHVAFPDVSVDVLVRHAAPADAILECATTSALLVLGRRHHRLPLGTHLGPVARAVLDRSPCPVMMVPEDDSRIGTETLTANAVAAGS